MKRMSGKQASRKTKRQQAAAIQGCAAKAGKTSVSKQALNKSMSKTREKKGMETVRIIAPVEEMKGKEVAERIGRRVCEAVRGSDRGPLFVELVAGHEGWSTGNMVTGTVKRKTRKFWSRQMVARLARVLRPGVPLYMSHQQGAGQRPQVGEIKSSRQDMKNNCLQATAVARITDPLAKQGIKTGKINTCSIEAEIVCRRDRDMANNSWLVSAVNKVTGVALGNSRTDRPGFPRAAVLAAVEEFEEKKQEVEDGPETGPEGRETGEQGGAQDDRRVEELTAELERKNQRLDELGRRLDEYEAREKSEKAAAQAEKAARKELDNTSLKESEKRLVIDEIKKRPFKTGDGMEEQVRSQTAEEVRKLDKLRELWSREFVKTPPEKEEQKPRNPLIPA